jgi:hypothetical protein
MVADLGLTQHLFALTLFVAVAVAVVLLNRRAMLSRTGAVTDVLLPEAASRPDTASGAAPAPHAVAGRGAGA